MADFIIKTKEASSFSPPHRFRPGVVEGERARRCQWFGGALVVEHRYAGDLAVGMIKAGFTA